MGLGETDGVKMRFLDVLVLMMRWWWGKFRRGRKRRRSAGAISIIVCGAPSVDDGIMDIGLIPATSSCWGSSGKIFLPSPGQSQPFGASELRAFLFRVQTHFGWLHRHGSPKLTTQRG